MIFFSLIFFMLFSCNDEDRNCTDASMEYNWTENRDINILAQVDSIIMDGDVFYFTEYDVTEGQSNLFEYNIKAQFCEDILDSGGSITFSMMVPADSTESFTFIDEQIIETSAFLEGTFLYPPHSVEEGIISGEKLGNDRWRISIDVITKPQEYQGDFGPEQITINEIFTIQQ